MNLKTCVTLALCLFVNAAQADIKNSQDILGGLLTRAGVTKKKPLNQSELTQLCEKGYTRAYHLYNGSGNQSVTCSKGTIHYMNIGDFRKPENLNKILGNISAGLSTGDRTFVHCNNGAHASGYVAAIALRSFCGISADDSVNYWDRTLGGYPLQEPNRSNLMKRLRNYPISSEHLLNEGQKAALGCSKY